MSDNAEEKLLLGPRAFKFDTKVFPYKDLWNHIEDIHENSIFCKKNKIYPNTNIITILGERGSGKTSLLLSLKNYLENLSKEERKNIEFNIHVLENPIDTSIVVDSNNIVKLILSLLFTSYINFINNQNNNKEIDREIIGQFAEINKTVNRLTKIEEGNDSLDDLLLTKSVFELKNSINELVKKYLIAIGKNKDDYLMIMIDDIDLNTKSCYEMLEQIRKYLCQNNIIIIISGNYKDFENTVLNEYVKQFTNILIKGYNDRDFTSEMQNKTTNYLIKVLPLPYHIDLSNNKFLIGDIYFKELIDIISKFNFFIPTDYSKLPNDLKDIVNIIIGDSLRFKVQLLYQLNRLLKDAKDKQSSDIKNDIKDILIDHITKTGYDSLRIKNINYDNFNYSNLILGNSRKIDRLALSNIVSLIFDNGENIEIFFKNFSVGANALFYDYKNIINKHKNYTQFINTKNLSKNNNDIYPWDLIPYKDENSKNIFACIYMLTIIANYKRGRINKDTYILSIYELLVAYDLNDLADNLEKLMIDCDENDLIGNYLFMEQLLTATQRSNLFKKLSNFRDNHKPSMYSVIKSLKKDYNLTTKIWKKIVDDNDLKSDYELTKKAIYNTSDINAYEKSYEKIIDTLKNWYTSNA